MKVLYVDYTNAGVLELVDISNMDSEKVQGCLAMIESGEEDLIKCENGVWHQAAIDSEEDLEDPDNEEGETITVYSIAKWSPIL